ncbi:MAG: amidohydrolase [Planctomycetota bacterium]|nr:amidohydrolase [Planctomycetota bacterium]
MLEPDERMGLPEPQEFARHYERAVSQGVEEDFAAQMKDGMTGVIGILENGSGPVTAMRFDIDALGVVESNEELHRPTREGFASVNPGMMHACGHDCHAAAGLAVAKVMARLRDRWRGRLMLIFQPAEEGVRGAKAIVSKGVLDDVNHLYGHHVLSGRELGEVVAGMAGYAATEKLDLLFTGEPAHAGGSPEAGKNAMLAAAAAVQGLYAIPRHSGGATRINAGILNAGTGMNVILPLTHVCNGRVARRDRRALRIHVPVGTQSRQRCRRQCRTAGVEVLRKGSAPAGGSDPELAKAVEEVAKRLSGVWSASLQKIGGSEDFVHMIQRVRANEGRSTNIGIGARFKDGPKDGRDGLLCSRAHTEMFDVDERAMPLAVKLLCACAMKDCGCL